MIWTWLMVSWYFKWTCPSKTHLIIIFVKEIQKKWNECLRILQPILSRKIIINLTKLSISTTNVFEGVQKRLAASALLGLKYLATPCVLILTKHYSAHFLCNAFTRSQSYIFEWFEWLAAAIFWKSAAFTDMKIWLQLHVSLVIMANWQFLKHLKPVNWL